MTDMAAAVMALLSDERKRAAVLAVVEAAEGVGCLAQAAEARVLADDLAPVWDALGRFDRAMFRALRWVVRGLGGAWAMLPDDLGQLARSLYAAGVLHVSASARYSEIAEVT